MSKKEKIARKMVEELVWLKEKEIKMFEKLKENGINLLPQEERENTMRVFGEIIQEIKEELNVYYGMRDLQAEGLFL